MHLRHTFLALLTLTLAAACSEDELYTDAPAQLPAETRTADVVMHLTLPTAWEFDDDDTRALPPGVEPDPSQAGGQTGEDDGWDETYKVDRIQIVTFRRRVGKKYKYDANDENDGFVYDPANSHTLTALHDTILTADEHWGAQHTHRVAACDTLHKTFGYEYQVIAIGYTSTRLLPMAKVGDFKSSHTVNFKGTNAIGEQHFFNLNLHEGLRIQDLTARLVEEKFQHSKVGHSDWEVWDDYLFGTSNDYILDGDDKCELSCTPQLFYAKCQLQESDSVAHNPSHIIKFAEPTIKGDSIDSLPLKATLLRGVAKVEVIFESKEQYHSSAAIYRDPLWITLLADNVVKQVSLANYDGFLAGQTINPAATFDKNTRFTTVDVLPSLQGSGRDTLTAYFFPGKTRLALRERYDGWGRTNGQICVKSQSQLGSATGVISPNVKDGVFFLRRNHKYIIKLPSNNYIFNHSFD